MKLAGKMSRGSWMKAGIRQPPVRAFMDDITISTKTAIEAKWILKEIEELISWARMKIKVEKSGAEEKKGEDRLRLSNWTGDNSISLREASEMSQDIFC